MMDECYGARAFSLPLCERCEKAPANTSLTFTYRGEEYATHYYCGPCCDIAWDEGVAHVDAKAAAIAAMMPPKEG